MHPDELTLNEYADDALTGTARADVERHLATCAACRGLVDDLRAIAGAAATLTPVDPPAAAWTRIAEALKKAPGAEAPASTRAGFARVVRDWRWLATAAIIVVATAVGLRLGPMAPRHVPPASSTPAPAASVDAQSVESELRQAEAHYDKAIKGLEQITNAGQGALDPATAATLQKNLSVIDQAISESRAAVHSQPNNEPAQASLLDNFKAKIGLLQDTVSLINEMRKGNDAGAARIVSGLKDKGE
jgi:anti-sigma factor RsiW